MKGAQDPPAAAGPLDRGFLPVERRLLEASLGGQRGFLILRLLLAGVLLWQALAAPARAAWAPWLAALPAAYALASCLIYFLRRAGRLSDAAALSTFMLDAGTALAVLALTRSGGEVYTALLVLLLGACLLQRPALVFSVSAAAALAFGLLMSPLSEDFFRVFPLRLALFLLIALFSVHIADYAGFIERRTARRFEERLAWLQRLSMVGRAMAAVLHEAKTPLGTIVLSAESAQAAIEKGEDPGPDLRAVTEEADHAVAVLQNFLDFVKPTRLDLAPLEIREPLLQAVSMAKPRLEDIGIEIELKALDGCVVRGSPRHLVQAFSNILQNAADATPKGGKLRISMQKRGETALVRFEDTGMGMSTETLERLFEPFSTSKAGEEGLGLGLSIVRWILREHGGDVEVESPGPGKGCRVSVLLPLAERPSGAGA